MEKILLCFFIQIFYTFGDEGIIYTQIAVGKTLEEISYRTVTVDKEARCHGICYHDNNIYINNNMCKSFDHDKLSGNNVIKCRFYSMSYQYYLFTDQVLKNAPNITYLSVYDYYYYNNKRDCMAWYEDGARESKVYIIYIAGKYKTEVFCNMDIDGGGWTVFQKRFDGSVDFNRNWNEYKNGFGDKNGEHWLGNNYLHLLTTHEDHDLYIQGISFANEIEGCKYSKFKVANESDLFRVSYLQAYGGYNFYAFSDIGAKAFKEMSFTTLDRDNDKDPNKNCATRFGWAGGWWYNGCFTLNVNGVYQNQEDTTEEAKGLIWYSWKSYSKSLKGTILMIKRNTK